MGIIRGDSLGSQFARKVVPAGDVNGDTLPDFLVLATGDQKVYLFHGKKDSLDTLPDLFFVHKAQLDEVGDINGDGKADFAMRETGQNYRISLYFGGSILDTIREGYIKGDSSGSIQDFFGRSVSAGKLSDTGDAQIVVFDPNYDLLGRVYAFNGQGGDFDSLPFWILDSLRMNGFFVWSAKIVGDINGDGFSDLAVGLPTFSSTQKGEVRIFLGGSVFDKTPDITLHPPLNLPASTAGGFGFNLASVGDLDNDGFAEFVVGASRTPLLYFGGNPFDTLPRFVLDRVADHFVNGGDINADGYTDLLVGRDEHPITGYAYVYYGGLTMDSVRDLEIRELDLPFPATGFGQTVAGLGDIDRDGSNDIAVGSRNSTFDDQDRGYLWVFKGLLPNMGVEEGKQNIPRNFTLQQNYPNPFNSSTIVSFVLAWRGRVRLEIFNIAGQLVKVLLDQEQPAGSHQVSWDGFESSGKPASSGVYLYRMKFGDEILTRKMVFL